MSEQHTPGRGMNAIELSERISDIACATEDDARAIAAAADELVRLHALVCAGGVQPLAPQQESPVVRALQSAILSGLSHEELLEKAHHLMTLTVNQARTIGELQEAAAAEAAPQQAAPAQEGGEA